jgi:hypothetical protein
VYNMVFGERINGDLRLGLHTDRYRHTAFVNRWR